MCCDDSGGSEKAPVPEESEFSKTLAQIMRERQDNAKKFAPLEDRLIDQVNQFQTPEYANQQAARAQNDVASQFAQSGQAADNQMASMGINPGDPRFMSMKRSLALGQGAAQASAGTMSRENTRRLAYDTLAATSGRGDAKVGQAISAAGQGGQLYNQAQANQIQYTQGQQQQDNGAMSGLGSLAGLAGTAMMFMSSRKFKRSVRPATQNDPTDAVRKMPVQRWRYKDGIGDSGAEEHTGPMAEDVQKATGQGDGTMVNLPDLVGTTLGAVQQMDRRIRRLESDK
jgi:hypothetical protein